MKVIYISCATLVALFLPYFSDLTAITAALTVTPTSLLFPVILWNKKHNGRVWGAGTAPTWRVRFHVVCVVLSLIMAAVAFTGAVAAMAIKIKQG